ARPATEDHSREAAGEVADLLVERRYDHLAFPVDIAQAPIRLNGREPFVEAERVVVLRIDGILALLVDETGPAAEHDHREPFGEAVGLVELDRDDKLPLAIDVSRPAPLGHDEETARVALLAGLAAGAGEEQKDRGETGQSGVQQWSAQKPLLSRPWNASDSSDLGQQPSIQHGPRSSRLRLASRSLLHVLGRRLLTHQALETEERFQDVFPEWSASAEQQDRDQPPQEGAQAGPEPVIPRRRLSIRSPRPPGRLLTPEIDYFTAIQHVKAEGLESLDPLHDLLA